MLYDRSYMRPPEKPSRERASAVTVLLVVTIGIFVLEQILNVSFPGPGGRPNSFLTNWFVLSVENFKELKVWTAISYAFLHSENILHILGNMLGLFFIGRLLEPLLGKQRFFILYFSGAVIGGLAYVFFHLNGGGAVIGASAAVSALLAFFCLRFPEQQITLLLFFVLPLTVKPKWVFWGFLGISTYLLLFSELQGTASIAHSAHLGGFLTGAVYYRYIFSKQNLFGGTGSKPSIELPNWFKRRKKAGAKISYRVNRAELQGEVDRILDKINKSGFSSLSNDEKATLDSAKELLNR